MQERLTSIINAFSGHKLLVIGDYMLDIYWIGETERISPEAPVPVVHIDWNQVRHLPGGAGNVVRNLQALGVQCLISGAVGDDEEAERLAHLPEWRGADASALIRWPGRRTVHKARVIARGQHVVRLDWEDQSPLTELELAQVLDRARAALPTVDGVVFSDYDKGNITAPLVYPLIKQAQEANKIVVADPKPPNFALFKNATVITPNQAEAAAGTGIRITDRGHLEDCGRRLLDELNLEAVFITRGARGIALFERANPPQYVPTIPADVYDISGAGDTVTATVAAALVAGANFFEAAVLANLAASLVVRHVGCYAPTAEELRQAVQANPDYLQSVTS